ncbi:MAG: hypothetical protein HGB11_15340, partial [Chlorobiales bacterium]|nr:hypothetical protein [Chlorobiales bacterium]
MTTQEIADFRGKLRAEIKNTRKGLSLEDWARRSGRVFNQLISFELFHKATSIHCYLSSELQREVDPRPILSWMLDAGKTVYVPAIKGREIFSVRYHKETATVEGKFGVREPDASVVADETKIDLVLVPLLLPQVLTMLFACRLLYQLDFPNFFQRNRQIVDIPIDNIWQRHKDVPGKENPVFFNQHSQIISTVPRHRP